ncbi:MAG TPA: hypothetical protein VF192_12340 [Longimicrobiales bacterium]
MSSLIPFHRVLIGCAIAFCFGYAAWEFAAYLRDRSPLALLLALSFAAIGVGLAFYLRHLRRVLGLPARE